MLFFCFSHCHCIVLYLLCTSTILQWIKLLQLWYHSDWSSAWGACELVMWHFSYYCVFACVCEGVSKEGVHAVLAGSAAAVQTRPLRLWSACARVRAEIRWTQKTLQSKHARRRGLVRTLSPPYHSTPKLSHHALPCLTPPQPRLPPPSPTASHTHCETAAVIWVWTIYVGDENIHALGLAEKWLSLSLSLFLSSFSEILHSRLRCQLIQLCVCACVVAAAVNERHEHCEAVISRRSSV